MKFVKITLDICLQDSFIADGKDVSIEFLDSSSQSLIAVQGPKTAQVLQPFVNVNLENLYFMNSVFADVCGIENCRITRCGYTGEDGVEISIPSKHATEIVETLLKNEFVKLAGLGARDTLRLVIIFVDRGLEATHKTIIFTRYKYVFKKKREHSRLQVTFVYLVD